MRQSNTGDFIPVRVHLGDQDGIRCSQRRGFLRDNPLRGEVRPVVHAPVARQIGGKFNPRDVWELDGTEGDQLLHRQGGIRRGRGRSPLGNLAAQPWLTAENLDAMQFSRRSKREEEYERKTYKDHMQFVAKHCWHTVILWFHALVVCETFSHPFQRYPCNVRQRVEKQRK